MRLCQIIGHCICFVILTTWFFIFLRNYSSVISHIKRDDDSVWMLVGGYFSLNISPDSSNIWAVFTVYKHCLVCVLLCLLTVRNQKLRHLQTQQETRSPRVSPTNHILTSLNFPTLHTLSLFSDTTDKIFSSLP